MSLIVVPKIVILFVKLQSNINIFETQYRDLETLEDFQICRKCALRLSFNDLGPSQYIVDLSRYGDSFYNYKAVVRKSYL